MQIKQRFSGQFGKILRASLMLGAVILLLIAPTVYSLSIPSQVAVSNFSGLACNNTYCVFPTNIAGTQNYFALNSSSACVYGYCGSATPNNGGATGTSANSVIQTVLNQLSAGSSVYYSFGNYSVVGDLNLTKVGVSLFFQPGTIFTFSGLTTGGLVYDPTPHGTASGPLYIYGFPTFAGSNSGKIALILRDGYSSAIYHNSTGRSNVNLNVRGTWTAGVSIEGVTYEGTFVLDVETTGPASGTGTGIQFQNSPSSDGSNAPNNNVLIKPELDVTPGTKGNSIGINLINGNNEVIENFDGNYITSNGTALKIATIGNRIYAPRFESNAHDINFTTGADKNSIILPIYTGDPSGNPTIVDTSTGVNNYQTDGLSNNYGQYFSPTSSLLSYYPMDEGSGTSLYDQTNTVSPGVLTNSPTWQTAKHCVFGNCLSFLNTSSEYVALTSPSSALPVTETLWFNATTFPVNGNKPAELAQIEAGDLALVANATGTYARLNGLGLGSSFAPEALITAHWYFLSAQVTSTYQQLCINVSDTALSCSSQLSGTTSGNLATWSLAKASTASFYYYNGKLDNAEIFSSALSQTQIAQLFQQSPSPFEILLNSIATQETCSGGKFLTSFGVPDTCTQGQSPSFVSNANTCTDTTQTTVKMAGFGTTFTIPPSGGFIGSLTFQVTTPATAGITSKFQVAVQSGGSPSCNGGSAGSVIGNQYTIETVAAAAGIQVITVSFAQSTGTYTAGQSEWLDLQLVDSSTASWTYSNPQLSITG